MSPVAKACPPALHITRPTKPPEHPASMRTHLRDGDSSRDVDKFANANASARAAFLKTREIRDSGERARASLIRACDSSHTLTTA